MASRQGGKLKPLKVIDYIDDIAGSNVSSDTKERQEG
jgi:hypothetical protein